MTTASVTVLGFSLLMIKGSKKLELRDNFSKINPNLYIVLQTL